MGLGGGRVEKRETRSEQKRKSGKPIRRNWTRSMIDQSLLMMSDLQRFGDLQSAKIGPDTICI